MMKYNYFHGRRRLPSKQEILSYAPYRRQKSPTGSAQATLGTPTAAEFLKSTTIIESGTGDNKKLWNGWGDDGRNGLVRDGGERC